MKQITIDASGWTSRNDLYDSVLSAIGAPEWHGHNLDALYESIVTDRINSLTAPYVVHVVNSERLPSELENLLANFLQLFDDARAEAGIEVYGTVQPPH